MNLAIQYGYRCAYPGYVELIVKLDSTVNCILKLLTTIKCKQSYKMADLCTSSPLKLWVNNYCELYSCARYIRHESSAGVVAVDCVEGYACVISPNSDNHTQGQGKDEASSSQEEFDERKDRKTERIKFVNILATVEQINLLVLLYELCH